LVANRGDPAYIFGFQSAAMHSIFHLWSLPLVASTTAQLLHCFVSRYAGISSGDFPLFIAPRSGLWT